MKLNIGSGAKPLRGYLNLDILPYPGVDLVTDLNLPLPFKPNSVTEICAMHVLEHVNDLIFTMTELHRISKPGAIIKLKSPYYKSKGAFKDPTHKSFFTDETFDYFDPEAIKSSGLPDYQLPAKFHIRHKGYIWSHPAYGYLPFKHSLKNHLWNIARTIYFELEVIK